MNPADNRHSETNPLLGAEAAFGAIALFIQPLLLTVRATHLSHALTVANIPDESLGIFTWQGHPFTLGTVLVTGTALTAAQMLFASICKNARDEGGAELRQRMAAVIWVLLSILDLGACFISPSGNSFETGMTLFIAAVVLLVETWCGIMIIDGLFIPIWKAVASAVGRAGRRS